MKNNLSGNVAKRRKSDIFEDKIVKKGKLSKSELYTVPTSEELTRLHETETLFHSNILRLQISELLNEIKIKDSTKLKIANWFEDFRKFLNGTDDSKEYNLSNLKWLKKLGIRLPFHSEKNFCWEGASFKYTKPESVEITGSFAQETLIGPEKVVDVVLEFPQSFFQHRDFLNYKYVYKKSLYMCYVAFLLKKSLLVKNLEFSYQHDNVWTPTLIVTPSENYSKRIKFQILTRVSNCFKLHRFRPSMNNVKSLWLNFKGFENDPPTPFYNTSILQDITLHKNNCFIKKYLTDNENLRDAIKMLKTWLYQRSLNSGFGGISGFIMTMYVLYLLQNKKINLLMSSYQILRNTWTHLTQLDLSSSGISLCTTDNQPFQPEIEDFHKHFDVVFVDLSGYGNLMANVPKCTFFELKSEAETALKCLDQWSVDGFDSLFMKPIKMIESVDNLFEVKNISNETLCALGVEELVDNNFWHWNTLVRKIYKLFEKGIFDRISNAFCEPFKFGSWPVDSSPPDYVNVGVKFGLILNPDSCGSRLTRGPDPNDGEVSEFRELWRDKSQLRRFQDGSLCEAVLWEASTLSEKRTICRDVVKFLLSTHLHIENDNLFYISNEIEDCLRPRCRFESLNYGSGEEVHSLIMTAMEKLGKNLHSVVGLPLEVASIQGVCPSLRFGEVFPPYADPKCGRPMAKSTLVVESQLVFRENPEKIPPWTHPVEVVLQMESSTQWPDDYNALLRLKSAFILKLVSNLQDQCQLKCSPGIQHFFVLVDGLVFKVNLFCEKELVAAKAVTLDTGLVKFLSSERTNELEYNYVLLPKLSSVLLGIHHKFPAWSVACRLVKRWLSSQLLLHYFGEVTVELLMAFIFLYPYPFSQPPFNPQTGFVRFLERLVSTAWKTTPIIVNFNDEMTLEEISQIKTDFIARREQYPALFIVTPYDKKSIFTKDLLSTSVFLRIIELSKLAVDNLNTNFKNWKHKEQEIFSVSYDPYDMVIHLKLDYVVRSHQSIDHIFSSKPSETTRVEKYISNKYENLPIYNFDPVQKYVEELRLAYGNFALFLHDSYGGSVVCVKWKPNVEKPIDFKTTHVNGYMSKDKDGKTVMIPNVEAIIEGIKLLGEKLIERIVINSEKWKFE